MKESLPMDCSGCVVRTYGDVEATARFCATCRKHLLQKSYCLALRDNEETLLPFIAVDDAVQATEYAGRLNRQGIPHVVLNWNPEQLRFSAVA